MYIAGESCDFSEASNAETTSLTKTTTLFGASAVARVCYSAATCWAFRKAPYSRTSLIEMAIACLRVPSSIKVLRWSQQLCICLYPSTVSGCQQWKSQFLEHALRRTKILGRVHCHENVLITFQLAC
ncbi:hypothetical protein MIR68_003588 [Amoeboaphelidium protococcarum]|nr:hypothetical protein MIR68_003588 [Amoeboaphelidium protococcarum]